MQYPINWFLPSTSRGSSAEILKKQTISLICQNIKKFFNNLLTDYWKAGPPSKLLTNLREPLKVLSWKDGWKMNEIKNCAEWNEMINGTVIGVQELNISNIPYNVRKMEEKQQSRGPQSIEFIWRRRLQ